MATRARKTSLWVFGGLVGEVLLLFAGPVVLGEGGILRYFELRRDLKRTQEQIAVMRAQNTELKRQLEVLRTGSPKALEEEARRHRLMGPNEELYEIEVR